MTEHIFPETGVSGRYVFNGEPVTVARTGKHGRPRKDGTQGGYVVFFGIDGNERRVALADWQKAVS